MQILNPEHHLTITEIKSVLLDLSVFLERIESEEKDISLVKDLIINLEDLFLIVIAGEYNSGKSAFINALLGDELLKTGVTPTTTDINILRYSTSKSEKRISPGQKIIGLPVKILQDVSIVDTPGTNAILREHEVLTTDYIPRSDLVLFITSVDRPFTESERSFLEQIRNWGKKIVVIINKTDIMEEQSELNEIRQFVSLNAKKMLGFEPKIFTLSAKDALKQKKISGESIPQLKIIEDYVINTLDPQTQFHLKILNPLGVMDNLTEKYGNIIGERLELLKNDIQLMEDINKQLELFKEDMMRSFRFRYADIDNTLLDYEKRGLEFFNNTFRLGRILDLLNKQRIQAEYNQQVLKGLTAGIDTKVNELIDWLVQEDLKQWQAITYKINQRIAKYENRILEDPASRQIRFERQKIIDTVKRETQKVIDKFDKEDEARKIAEDAQMAVAASAAIEAGALGLGALVTLLATTASADLTGILLAGITATLGFFIIPAKRRQTRSVFSKNINEIRENLSHSLTEEFQKQVDLVMENVRNTISPYSRFVRAEHIKLQSARDTLDEMSQRSFHIRDKVQNI